MSKLCERSAIVLMGWLATVASATPETTWSLAGAELQYADYDQDGNPLVLAYPDVAVNIASSQLDNGIKLFSPGPPGANTFLLTGETYRTAENIEGGAFPGNRFTMFGIGTFNGAAWNVPTDFIRTSFDVDFEISGGSLGFYNIQTFFFLFDSMDQFMFGVGSSTSYGPYGPGEDALNFAFNDDFGFFGDVSAAASIFWAVDIYFEWSGYNAADTLALRVPPNSIDIQALSIPAPGWGVGLAACGVLGLRRRR